MAAGPIEVAWVDAGYRWTLVRGLRAPALLLPEDGTAPLACVPPAGDREEHFGWCACDLARQRAGGAGLTEGLMALSPRRPTAVRGAVGLLKRVAFAGGASLWGDVARAALGLAGGVPGEEGRAP